MNYRLIVGCDHSKLKFDAALIHVDHPNEVFQRPFPNNKKGFRAMIAWIRSLYPHMPFNEVLFCMEHTGYYSLNLCLYLSEQALHNWVENPLQIKRSLGITRGKNDQIDARRIAQYALAFQFKARLFKMSDENLLKLRLFTSEREQMVKILNGLKTSVKQLSVLPKAITEQVIRDQKKLQKHIESNMCKIEAQMVRVIESDDHLKHLFNLVQTVPGIGPQTAVAMLIYTQAFNAFTDWRKFACYCGIAPFEHSSGTSVRGKTRVSQFANKKVKSLLTLAALNAARFDPELNQYYLRKRAEGKNAMSVINAVRNKLVSRIFSVIHKNQPYVPSKAA